LVPKKEQKFSPIVYNSDIYLEMMEQRINEEPEWVTILKELYSKEKETTKCKEQKLTDYI